MNRSDLRTVDAYPWDRNPHIKESKAALAGTIERLKKQNSSLQDEIVKNKHMKQEYEHQIAIIRQNYDDVYDLLTKAENNEQEYLEEIHNMKQNMNALRKEKRELEKELEALKEYMNPTPEAQLLTRLRQI